MWEEGCVTHHLQQQQRFEPHLLIIYKIKMKNTAAQLPEVLEQAMAHIWLVCKGRLLDFQLKLGDRNHTNIQKVIFFFFSLKPCPWTVCKGFMLLVKVLPQSMWNTLFVKYWKWISSTKIALTLCAFLPLSEQLWQSAPHSSIIW